MKFFKYIIIAFASMIALASCEKHDLGYDFEQVSDKENALITVRRLIPEATNTATRAYVLMIDDKPMWQGTGVYLGQRDFVPSQSRHYIIAPGVHNLKLYLQATDEQPYYDQNFEVKAGMQEVIITNLNAAPVVIDNTAEYPHDVTELTSEAFWLRFVNLMYQDENYTIPTYKLQYWYQDPTDLQWYPASDPVGFGEASPWTKIHVDQFAPQRSGESGTGSSYAWADNRVQHTVSSGSCTIYYKIKVIEEDGTESWFTYTRTGGEPTTDYKDYWTGYIGRHEFHFFRGCRIATTSGTSNTAAWITQGAKY
ncbi:MAG: hypothetical protein IIW53_05205 [Rikenellaceae bacterium]|nr:hypothetical protein [Rikenellaceae bacterium]